MGGREEKRRQRSLKIFRVARQTGRTEHAGRNTPKTQVIPLKLWGGKRGKRRPYEPPLSYSSLRISLSADPIDMSEMIILLTLTRSMEPPYSIRSNTLISKVTPPSTSSPHFPLLPTLTNVYHSMTSLSY